MGMPCKETIETKQISIVAALHRLDPLYMPSGGVTKAASRPLLVFASFHVKFHVKGELVHSVPQWRQNGPIRRGRFSCTEHSAMGKGTEWSLKPDSVNASFPNNMPKKLSKKKS